MSFAESLRRVARAVGAGTVSAPPRAPTAPLDINNPTSIFTTIWDRGIDTRAQYLWPLALAAKTAKRLGFQDVAAIEFGVAGGNGLLALERAAEAIENLLGITIAVAGFDAGSGMPPPQDHRDAPWIIAPGYFPMDAAALRGRLSRAELVLGPVNETISKWLAGSRPPVGFVSFDLDYYSSTMHAFQLFDAAPDRLLPRVACYFDDLFGYGWSDFNGERAAIRDFNHAHEQRKIGPVYGLRYEVPPAEAQKPWPEQIYLAHFFDHPLYDVLEVEVPKEWFDAHKLRPA